MRPTHLTRLILWTLALVAGLGGSAVAQEPITLRVATFLPERSMTVRGLMAPWVEAIKEELGDRIEIQEFYGGALGKTPDKQFDLALDGIADVVGFVPSYTPGRFPGFSIDELPLLAETGEEASVAQWRFFEQGYIGGFDQAKVLGILITTPYKIHTKVPFDSEADLKGLKIRTSGPFASATVERFGAIPLGIPLSQTTEALSRGVVDGVLLGCAAVGVFRMDSIALHHYEPPLGSGPVALVMNKDKWNSLPKDVQEVMEKHAGEGLSRSAGQLIDSVDKENCERMRADSAHTFVPASEEIRETGRVFFAPVYDLWIEENSQEAFDAYLRIISDIRAGN